MPQPVHILSVGYDHTLMPLRSMILRGAGYEVEEAYTMELARSRAESDSIDLLLLCHTLPEGDQKDLIASVQRSHRTPPVLCITSQEFTFPANGGVAVESSPIELLEGVRMATGVVH